MEESTEEDHHGVQQDIQQIHKVLGENEDLEELEESDDDNEEGDGDGKDDGAYLGAGTSSSGPVLSQILSDRSQDEQPVPESLSLARSLEPSAENLLQLNLSYQDMVCTLLDNIKAARRKNATIQKNVASKTTTYVKGARPISHFQKHYFSAHGNIMPPLSDEAKEIKSKNIPTPFIPPAKSWSADEDRALYEGVRNDGLQRSMKPLMARQEILYQKRQSAIDDEKQQLTREINQITNTLEHLKAPEEELLGDRMRDIDWLKISSLHLNGERSEVECQLRWQNILHPSINKKEWSREEELRLNEILENARGKDWTDVINELGTNRSPFDCFSNFQHREISQYVSRPFSQEEDEVITELCERFKIGNHIQFNKVAFFMDQRLPRQIADRWQKKLNPKSKWGYWTKEEDEALINGIQEHGFKWTKLKEYVNGRSASQIRDRWMYTLDPNNTKGNYAYNEDISILECVKLFGVGNWVNTARKLVEVTGNTRTPNSVLHRFNTLFHRFFRKVKGINLQDSASIEVLNSIPLNTILDEMIEYRQSLGERKEGTRKYTTELYKRKKRKPKTPPRPLYAKNASLITKQYALSELDQQLMNAIKPIGWALPIPSTWREFYGSKAVRRQRRHYIFSVLLKALDISVAGNEGLLASMVTNHEGIKVLKEGQLLPPKTKETTVKDDGEPVEKKAKSSEKREKKSKNSKGKSSKKVKKANSSDRIKEAGSIGGQSSQSNVAISQQCAPVSQANVAASHGSVPMSQANLTVSQGNASNVATSQGLVPISQGNVPMSQGNVTELPLNATMSQVNVPIPNARVLKQEHQKRVAFGPPDKTVKTELHNAVVRNTPQTIFGKGTLRVGEHGYLVPVQNYVSAFGVYAPEKRVVTLMRPRVDGGIQTGMQLGGFPVPNQQPYPITELGPVGLPMAVAPVPIQSATTNPQVGGVHAPMAQLPMQPATNMLQPMGSHIAAAPVLPSIATIPRPQHSRIIHVPGKGYLVPLNTIKQEPGTFPAPPFPTMNTNIAFNNLPTSVLPGQAVGVTPTPSSSAGSSVVVTPTPSSSAGSAVGLTLTPRSSAGSAVGVTPTLSNSAGVQPAVQEAVNDTVEEDNTGNSTVPSAATSSQSQSCEQQESGTLHSQNGQSSSGVDKKEQYHNVNKDGESLNNDTSGPSSPIGDIKKFEPDLPVLPPNEATIAGLMALLLQRKQLELNAGKKKSVRKVKSWSCESKDKGILRGKEGLLQELSASEVAVRLAQEAESKIAAYKQAHCEPGKSSSVETLQDLPQDADATDTESVWTKDDLTDSDDEVEADAEDTRDGKLKGRSPALMSKRTKQRLAAEKLKLEQRKQRIAEIEAANRALGEEGTFERRTPVPVGAWKKTLKQKQQKKISQWTTVSNESHAKTLDNIRNSDWYEKLQPRFLSMFLWPALLSIVGPHRKKLLIQNKVNKSENTPCGNETVNPTDDADIAGNTQKVTLKKRGRGRYPRGVKKCKTPPAKCKVEGSRKPRKAPVRVKDVMKKTDGVARRTRRASLKKSGTNDKISTPNYEEIPSDVDEVVVSDSDRADSDEEHPQAFMAFGFPAGGLREETQEGTKEIHTVTSEQSLHQAQEDGSTLSGPSTIQVTVEVHNPPENASSESVSSKRPETSFRTPSTFLSKTPPRRSGKKRRIIEEEADVIEASLKRAKQV